MSVFFSPASKIMEVSSNTLLKSVKMLSRDRQLKSLTMLLGFT